MIKFKTPTRSGYKTIFCRPEDVCLLMEVDDGTLVYLEFDLSQYEGETFDHFLVNEPIEEIIERLESFL